MIVLCSPPLPHRVIWGCRRKESKPSLSVEVDSETEIDIDEKKKNCLPKKHSSLQ